MSVIIPTPKEYDDPLSEWNMNKVLERILFQYQKYQYAVKGISLYTVIDFKLMVPIADNEYPGLVEKVISNAIMAFKEKDWKVEILQNQIEIELGDVFMGYKSRSELNMQLKSTYLRLSTP